MKSLGFIKKNIKYIILALLILTGILYVVFRERKIVNLTKALVITEQSNISLKIERENLTKALLILQDGYDKQKNANDSMKLVLGAKQKELKDLQAKHKREIDSLLNVSIPNDTIYVRLGVLYPNFDAGTLDYPFGGSQIRQIYSTAILFPRVQSEYALQGKSLKSCLDLNDGFELNIQNLNEQVKNLKANIGLCDTQIGNYQKQNTALNKQIKQKVFWGWIWKGSTIFLGTLAILK
jgi:hypothetical protein